MLRVCNTARRALTTLSHVKGCTETPLLNITIDQAMENAANQYPENSALIVTPQNIRWNYQELSNEINKVSFGLASMGLTKGSRLGVWLNNCAEWTVLQFATAKAGIILVNINPAYREHELQHCLNLVGCEAIVVDASSKQLGVLKDLCKELECSMPGDLQSVNVPSLKSVIAVDSAKNACPNVPDGCIHYEEIRTEAREPLPAIDPDDAINIQFTSGTTGAPKGATLTHNNIVNNGFFVGQKLKLTPKDKICIPVPLYHCFGMVLGNMACVTHGACMVYPKALFDAENTLKVASKEQCTGLYGVPTMFIHQLALHNFETFDLSTLRTGIMAGSICPIDTMQQVMQKMNLNDITICYGMTETSPVSFQSDVSDSAEKRASTVGRVHPHVECKVVDPLTGKTLARNEPGELYTRGYSVMKGYWNDAEKTKESIDVDGWMKTGDLAVLDEDGYCTIVGRLKDIIIRGGENIYPREIEDQLLLHESIQNAAVVGVPDPIYGEAVCACLILQPGHELSEEKVKEFIRIHLAHYKTPKYVMLMQDFPMTVTGKIQKFILQEQMKEYLDL